MSRITNPHVCASYSLDMVISMPEDPSHAEFSRFWNYFITRHDLWHQIATLQVYNGCTAHALK